MWLPQTTWRRVGAPCYRTVIGVPAQRSHLPSHTVTVRFCHCGADSNSVDTLEPDETRVSCLVLVVEVGRGTALPTNMRKT